MRAPGDTLLASPRSPTAAFVIALVPGAVLHGAGHLYAGDTRMGEWLALTEAAGYAAMFTSHARGADVGDRAITYGLGAGLFFGSWLYDILAAPGAVRARNAMREAQAASARWELTTVPSRDGVRLQVSRSF